MAIVGLLLLCTCRYVDLRAKHAKFAKFLYYGGVCWLLVFLWFYVRENGVEHCHDMICLIGVGVGFVAIYLGTSNYMWNNEVRFGVAAGS